ncbi:Rgg family transcriptional regulator ElrR [Enterococcus faecalis]|uniref:Rgg family transcriptional regulator ElrR n=1 Tax=Enterococcus faecalis TaxID=1351 RepID=UPI00325B421C
MEYRPLGEEIERIRKGKNIPLRVFDENGVSSRSYQRFVQGNSELRISDLAIIVEILSISPMEMTEKLTPMSKTVLAKEQFNQAIFSKNFQESSRIVADYRAYYDKSSFALGKQEVMYSMLALEYLFNPQTVVTKEEIIALENQILERLIHADVYTIFNLKFLALQKNVGLQPFPTSLLFRVLQSVNEREIIDIRSLEIIEQVIIDFLFAAIVSQNVPHILHVLSMFKEYEVGENNWRMILWKKIAEKIELILTNEEIFADWSIFKEQILLSITLFLPKSKQEFFAGQLEKIEDSLKEIKEN